MSAIIVGISDGHLTSSEAGDLAALVENYVRALEAADLEQRITELESKLPPGGF
jgi:hypothetical protein